MREFKSIIWSNMNSINAPSLYGKISLPISNKRNRRAGLKFFDSADWVMTGSSDNKQPVNNGKIEAMMMHENNVHGSPLKTHEQNTQHFLELSE